MERKKHTAEQIIQRLRGAENALAQGQPVTPSFPKVDQSGRSWGRVYP